MSEQQGSSKRESRTRFHQELSDSEDPQRPQRQSILALPDPEVILKTARAKVRAEKKKEQEQELQSQTSINLAIAEELNQYSLDQSRQSRPYTSPLSIPPHTLPPIPQSDTDTPLENLLNPLETSPNQASHITSPVLRPRDAPPVLPATSSFGRNIPSKNLFTSSGLSTQLRIEPARESPSRPPILQTTDPIDLPILTTLSDRVNTRFERVEEILLSVAENQQRSTQQERGLTGAKDVPSTATKAANIRGNEIPLLTGESHDCFAVVGWLGRLEVLFNAKGLNLDVEHIKVAGVGIADGQWGAWYRINYTDLQKRETISNPYTSRGATIARTRY